MFSMLSRSTDLQLFLTDFRQHLDFQAIQHQDHGLTEHHPTPQKQTSTRPQSSPGSPGSLSGLTMKPHPYLPNRVARISRTKKDLQDSHEHMHQLQSSPSMNSATVIPDAPPRTTWAIPFRTGNIELKKRCHTLPDKLVHTLRPDMLSGKVGNHLNQMMCCNPSCLCSHSPNHTKMIDSRSGTGGLCPSSPLH